MSSMEQHPPEKKKDYEIYNMDVYKLFEDSENKDGEFLNFGNIDISIKINTYEKQHANYFKKDIPIYIMIDNTFDENLHKLIIVQNNIVLVHFYTTWIYYDAMTSLVINPKSSINYCRIKIVVDYDKSQNWAYKTWFLKMTVYVKPDIIQKMYESVEIPMLLNNLIYINGIKCKRNLNFVPKQVTLINNNELILPNANRPFYPHQASNITWAINREINPLDMDSPILHQEYYSYHPPCLQEPLIYLKDSDKPTLVDINNIPNTNFKIYGGILCDTVGLGKTYSLIGLCLANPVPLTIIVCPGNLCSHWANEFETHTNEKNSILKILGIKQFKKYHQNPTKYKYLICTLNSLINESIIEHEKPSIHELPIDRIIYDESHTLISEKKFNRKERDIYPYLSLCYQKAKYTWLCSATLDFTNTNLNRIINLLTGQFVQISDYSYNNIELMNRIVRLNTKNTVESYINIPEPNIQTIYLDQTNNEKIIYQSAVSILDKIQLCSHLLVCEVNANILGKEPISLNDATTKFLKYYNKRLDYYTKREETLETAQVGEFGTNTEFEIEELKHKTTQIISDTKFKINIYTLLEETINQEDCPVCLTHLRDGITVVAECGHMYCSECIKIMFGSSQSIKCAICRKFLNKKDFCALKHNELDNPKSNDEIGLIEKWGTKLYNLVNYLKTTLENPDARIIIFSRFVEMLKLIQNVFDESDLSVIRVKGSSFQVSASIRKFILNKTFRIIMLHSDTMSCGINLTEASHIVLLDTFTADSPCLSKSIEEQAIGRAVRIGQTKNVEVRRFVMRNTIEEDRYDLMIN